MNKKVAISLILKLVLLSTLVQANNQTKRLNEIVVTAKSHKTQEDIPASVTVITAEDIGKLNATDVKDILLKQAGIIEVAATRSAGRTNISIRGTKNNHTLFLVDGKRVNDTASYIESSDFEYSMVPLDSIERIEIIKGAKSSIYGSDAVGGVVNIITKKDNRAFYGSLDIKAGSFWAKNGGNEQSFSANIGGKVLEKLYISLDASKTTRDASGDGTFTFIEGLDSINSISKLRFDIDDTQNIYASYMKGEDKREDYKGPKTYDIKRDIYSFGYEKIFNKIALSLDYTNAKTSTKVGSVVFQGTHELQTDVIKIESKISLLDYNYIVIGAETQKEKYARINKSTSVTQAFDRRAYNYYIQDEIDLNSFIFTLGTILDDNEKYAKKISSNIGALYKIDDKQRLKLNYSEGFKAPSLKQGDGGYIFEERPVPAMKVIVLGNDDLKPETSKSYEIAYEFYGNDGTFKLAAFKTDLKDMIEVKEISRVTGFPVTITNLYSNIKKANIKGIETDFTYEFNENHTISANYTFLKTQDEETKEELKNRPKHTFNIGLSSHFAYGISSYLNANYVGEQYYTQDRNPTILKAHGYTIFNAQISKKIIKDLTARIGVNNIGDKEFKDGYPSYIERRFAYVGLNYRF